MSRVGWGIVKWVLIPVALVALGYFVIGPKLGSQVLPTNVPEPVKKPEPQAATTKKYPEPQIDVTVDSLQQASENRRRKRRSHRRRSSSNTQNAASTPATSTSNDPGETQN